MDGTIGLSAFMVFIGAAALLFPGRLTSFGPFGRLLIYQRVAKSRPLMLLTRFSGAVMLLMGALFGILGVLFADPILASLKVVLVDLSNQQAAREGEGPEVVAASKAAT